jgi:hypothetical protein
MVQPAPSRLTSSGVAWTTTDGQPAGRLPAWSLSSRVASFGDPARKRRASDQWRLSQGGSWDLVDDMDRDRGAVHSHLLECGRGLVRDNRRIDAGRRPGEQHAESAAVVDDLPAGDVDSLEDRWKTFG